MRMPSRRTLSNALVLALGLAALAGCGSDSPLPPEGDAGLPALSDGGPGPEVDAGPPPPPADVETGRMVGMTEAHNRLRAMVSTSTPLPPLAWSSSLAATAQAWAEHLATTGCGLTHSTNEFGENLYWQRGLSIGAADVVQSWYDEVACYTYGPFMNGDACDMACIAAQNSNGCGHYTQVVWRDTQRVGCGVATCSNGAEIWACNYDPAGNYLRENPY